MVNIFGWIGLAVAVGLILFCIWALICNQRTYKFQMSILDRMKPGRPDFRELHDLWGRVSYDAHFHALLFMRDPRPLYSPRLLALIEQ